MEKYIVTPPISHFLKLTLGKEKNKSKRDWVLLGAQSLLTKTMCHFWA